MWFKGMGYFSSQGKYLRTLRSVDECNDYFNTTLRPIEKEIGEYINRIVAFENH
jgi:hypothetical protein